MCLQTAVDVLVAFGRCGKWEWNTSSTNVKMCGPLNGSHTARKSCHYREHSKAIKTILFFKQPIWETKTCFRYSFFVFEMHSVRFIVIVAVSMSRPFVCWFFFCRKRANEKHSRKGPLMRRNSVPLCVCCCVQVCPHSKSVSVFNGIVRSIGSHFFGTDSMHFTSKVQTIPFYVCVLCVYDVCRHCVGWSLYLQIRSLNYKRIICTAPILMDLSLSHTHFRSVFFSIGLNWRWTLHIKG